jgi:ABC-type uncharacterized transport system substrate-binding protein
MPRAVGAQPPADIRRIGFPVLNSPSIPPMSGAPYYADDFRQALREKGYVEGRDIVIEWRSAGGKPERLDNLVTELVQLKVDVIVAPTPIELTAAKQATRAIPIVMVAIGDPVGQGFVHSLARPGANITGTSTFANGLVAKQLELLREVIPTLARVAVLKNPANMNPAAELDEAARALKVRLQVVDTRGPSDFEAAFSAMARQGAQGLLVMPDAMLVQHRSKLANLARQTRLPTVSQSRGHPEAGGLMAYGADRRDLYRRAATYVDKILKGAKPADLPVEQPTKFELVINLQTAKALGLTIPQSLLLRADQIIE